MVNKKPNVILFFVDDLGYGDVSAFNPESKIKTKNLDKLAEAGMKFTDSHATSAVCSPSRYGLLTGRYNWRSRLKSYVLPGDSESLIEEDRETLASMLKKEGYHTAAVGKWHLGLGWQLLEEKQYEKFGLNPNDFEETEYQHGRDGVFDPTVGIFDFEGLDIDYSKPITFGPNQLGFDYFYGTPASLDQPPFVIIENDRVTEEPNAISGLAQLDRMGATQQQEWQNGVIAPNFIHIDVPDMMQNKVLDLVDEYSETEDPFFIYYPNHLVHGPIVPKPEFEGKSGVGIYGDFVLQLDHYVGEIMDKLKEKGIFEDTIFIFTSDNGVSGVAGLDHLRSLGHESSYKFRGTKFDIYEGGHREPTIVTYPKIIEGGTSSDAMVSHSDLYQSIADLLKVETADNEGEDSISNLPLWTGEKESIREDIVHSSANGGFSIRRGFWKLVMVKDSGAAFPTGDSADYYVASQLYDLRDDISEEHNVIEEHPELVEKLTRALEDQIKSGRSTEGSEQLNNFSNPSGKWDQIQFVSNYDEYMEELKTKFQDHK